MNGNYASCLPPSIVWISLNISGQKGQIGTSNKCDIQDTTEARHWHFPLLNAIRSPTFWGCKSEYLQPFNRLQKVPPSIGKKTLGGKTPIIRIHQFWRNVGFMCGFPYCQKPLVDVFAGVFVAHWRWITCRGLRQPPSRTSSYRIPGWPMLLVGGNSKIFYFHPELLGKMDPIKIGCILFNWGWWNNHQLGCIWNSRKFYIIESYL